MIIKIVNCSYNSIQFNVSLTMTHEMGHALGFVDHTSYGILSVMNGSNSTDILQTIDIQTIKQIYDLFYS